MKNRGVSIALATLLALSCLTSCITVDNTLGSALVPTNQDITIRTATIDLPVGMKMADSLQTSILQSSTIGSIRSDQFGLFRSDAAVSVTAAYDSIIWGKNPSVHSLVLSLALDSAQVVDPTQRYIPQNIYVHRLKKDLDSTMVYNNSITAADYDHEVLTTGGVVYAGGESYAVNLNPKLGEELFRIPMATLDSSELFMKAFKGLYFRCDDPLEGTEGGRLNVFDLSSSSIILTYDYDDDNGDRKRSSATFSLGAYFCVNVSTSGARDLETNDAIDGIYAEGLCGIKPHIDALRLRDLMDSWAAANQIPKGNLIIAKATVSFPFEYYGDYKQFDYYPRSLYPCQRTRGDHKVFFSPIDEINDNTLEAGSLDRSKLCYTSNITFWLQDLLKRDRSKITADDDLWIMSTQSSYSSYTGVTSYYADYFYYSQGCLNGMGDVRHPELRLTFAVLK